MPATKARQARHNKAVQTLGRIGMGCYGLVYLLIGYLAVRIAIGGGGQEADGRGAVAEVGSTPVGGVLLWVLAAGLVAYGLWQALLAAVGYTWIDKERKRAVKRVTSGVRCLVGISLGVYAAQLAAGAGGQGSGDQKQQEYTAMLLGLPAGPFLVIVVAVIVFGVAVASVVNGVRRNFVRDLDLAKLPSGTKRWVERLGRIGYAARGVVFGVVAVLLGFAALEHDPSRSGGLDAALRTLAAQPFGTVLLIAVAAGVAAFGAYCVGAARAQRG
ncbi:DUF1206 domain-containing protein [Amycolatopsis oliviviridis]|uniref:DUF1206 domain-containing protein n=1 Tax=Amycolatopsis oliviviridis TaxID=1471590 RepID=A0ABQ3M4B5_9PSEU|nr:DUF1206 domain-containing protein [Amycolatopsis oliviviridis]GHH31771.1 hypothetical protein GCM10017790_67690 [Amycolatopsis oliviviridis]